MQPMSGEVEEAKKHPNGWVFRIHCTFGADAAVPPEAIVGAWKVDGEGRIVGEFLPNANFNGATKEKKSWLPWKK